jgi:hypothetical protein
VTQFYRHEYWIAREKRPSFDSEAEKPEDLFGKLQYISADRRYEETLANTEANEGSG